MLAVLAGGPLAFGAVHEPVFIPMLCVLYLAGAVSWAHGHWARSHGHGIPQVPGRRLLAGFHGLVLFQLVPLPPALLALLSPGSAAFHAAAGLEGWPTITVSGELTLRGLAFLVGMTMLYATVFRDFRDPSWRRRLVYTVIGTGLLITVVALVQARSAEPTKIYGWWKPTWDWAVFGPYVNRNHFAGFVVMTIPLAVSATIGAGRRLGRAWERRRRHRWLALGDPEGLAVVRWAMVAVFLLVGLLLSGSRAGAAGLAVGCLALVLLAPRGYRVAGVTVVVLGLALLWADFSGVVRGFQTRGIKASRIDPWLDQARLIPEFPVFGVGFNALGPAYRPIQENPSLGSMDQAHNEYLQVLLDTGILGAALLLPLFLKLLGTGFRTARESSLAAGLTAAVLASSANNLFDFNWQIPGNAATFFALAGLVVGVGASLTVEDAEP